MYSSFVQHHDELWIPDGCGVPLILRNQHKYGYSLVSAAAILMQGDDKSHQNQLAELLRLAKEQHGGWQMISMI
jgi:hypothetical protein